MNKTIALTRAALKSTFRTNGSKRKKSKIPAVGAVFLFALLGIMMAFSFFAMFAGMSQSLQEQGLSSMPVQGVSYIIAAVIMLFFTVFQAQATVFRAKDLDLLMAMPVTPFQILISKIASFYLSNLMFGSIVLVPAAVATFVFNGFSVYTLIVLLINLLTIPCITITISFIFAFLLSLIPEKSKFNKIFSVVISLVFLAAYFYFYSRLMDAIALFAASAEAFVKGASYYLPIRFLLEALNGNALSLLLLAVLSVGAFLLLIFVLSKAYFVLIRSSNRSVKTKKTLVLGNEKQRPIWIAVFKKEKAKFFSSTIYILNSGIGILMLLGFSIFSLFGGGVIKEYVQMFGLSGSGMLGLFAAAAACLFILMTSTTSSSISLEGKNFWVMRTSPIKCNDMFIGKVLVNLLVIEPIWLVSSIVLIFSLNLSLLEWLLLFIIGTLAGIFTSLFGLLMNLCFPKIDAVSDVQVIKQSLAASLGYFGGILISIPVYIVAFLFLSAAPIYAMLFTALCYFVLSLVTFIILRFNGEKLLNRIIA